jgi:cupin fold WbuC family metalloprotein
MAMVKEAAAQAERGRARICLHKDPGDAVQDMVIVHTTRSFDRPHRHFNKSISILVLEGALLVPLFNDEGHVVERIELSEMGGDKPFLVRLSGTQWHSCIPLTDPVVIFESMEGPFEKDSDFYPQWAPPEGPELESFLRTVAGEPAAGA